MAVITLPTRKEYLTKLLEDGAGTREEVGPEIFDKAIEWWLTRCENEVQEYYYTLESMTEREDEIDGELNGFVAGYRMAKGLPAIGCNG